MTLIYDKFNCIENHVSHIEKEDLHLQIRNYIENYLHSNIHVLAFDYIKQLIHFKRGIFEHQLEICTSPIYKYIHSSREKIRVKINASLYTLTDLDNFLVDFNTKIKYMIFDMNFNQQIGKTSLDFLQTMIIEDPIIMNFIQSNINDDFGIYKLINTIVTMTCQPIHKDIFISLVKVLSEAHLKKIKEVIVQPDDETMQPTALYSMKHLIKYIQKYRIYRYNEYQILIDSEEFAINYFITNVLKCDEYVIYSLVKSQETILNNSICSLGYYRRNSNIFSTFYSKLINYLQALCTSIVDIKITHVYIISFIISCMQQIQATEHMQIRSSKDKLIYRIIIAELLNKPKIIDKLFDILNESILYDKTKGKCNSRKIIGLISFCTDKDVIINLYYKHLNMRLINSTNTNTLSCEKSIYRIFYALLLANRTNIDDRTFEYNVSRILVDYEQSMAKNIYDMCNKTEDNIIINTKIVSHYLNINTNAGVINDLEEYNNKSYLVSSLHAINNNYNGYYKNQRTVSWIPQYGEVTITYLNVDIKLLPIQYFVLELFNNTNVVSINTVMNYGLLKNYSKQYKQQLISSLLHSELMYTDGDNLNLVTHTDFKTNLITCFYECQNTNIALIDEQNKLIHSRQEIIRASVNHFIKKKNYTFDELFDTVKKYIKLFVLEKTLFTESLLSMISKSYILKDGDNYKKLY